MPHIIALFLTVSLHVMVLIFIKPSLTAPPITFVKTAVAPLHVSLMQAPQTIMLESIVESKKQMPVKKIIKKTRLPGDRDKASVANKITPIYPKNALNQNLEGKIVVKVKINQKGIISNIQIIQSTGHSILDNAFIHTLKYYYSFKPKRVMGKNVSSYINLSYEFKI